MKYRPDLLAIPVEEIIDQHGQSRQWNIDQTHLLFQLKRSLISTGIQENEIQNGLTNYFSWRDHWSAQTVKTTRYRPDLLAIPVEEIVWSARIVKKMRYRLYLHAIPVKEIDIQHGQSEQWYTGRTYTLLQLKRSWISKESKDNEI
jgi:hypothetical protein